MIVDLFLWLSQHSAACVYGVCATAYVVMLLGKHHLAAVVLMFSYLILAWLHT